MKRKVLCSLLAILIVLASFPLTAFAADGEKTITDISVTANRNLIEKSDGWYNEEGVTSYFYYDAVNNVRPTYVITYSDGSKVTCQESEINTYVDYVSQVTTQSVETEFGVGTHTMEVDVYYNSYEDVIRTSFEFTIEKNPVESIEVTATEKLKENVNGWYNWIDPEDESKGRYFYYQITETYPMVTVNYNDGRDSVTCNWGDCYDVFGSLPEIYDEQNDGVVFEPGVYKTSVEFMGFTVDYEFEILADPIESITVKPTTELREFIDGTHDWADPEDPFKGLGSFNYDIMSTYPEITVTFNDGRDPVTCGWYECYDLFGDNPSYDMGETVFKPGENTVKVNLLNHEADFTFTIDESPVKSVSVKILESLMADVSGHTTYESVYDEEKDEYYTVPYFYYDIDNDAIEVTVEYKDEAKAADTFTLNDVHDYFDEITFVTYLGKQDSETKLTVGKHKGILAIFGEVVEFEYEIIANPVKKVEAIVNSEIIENKNGYWTTDEEGGDEYYYYYLDDLDVDFKVTFTDGTVKEYKTDRELDQSGYSWEIEIYQDAYNPLKRGVNNGKAIFNGVEAEFTFNIVEDPVKSITLTPTKELTQYVDGWFEYDGEDYSFYHDVNLTYPDVTFNYKDGTKKTYSYTEYVRFIGYGIDFETNESIEKPLAVGKNTVKATIEGYTVDYTFVIKKGDKEVTKLEVTPEAALVENTSSFFLTDSNDNKFAIYFPDQIRYTVKLTYADGTAKTYKNVEAGDKIDGSYFDVSFPCMDYEGKYKIGLNHAEASYRNVTCDFKVSVVANTYTAITLSGDTDFKVTLTKADGTKEVYTAKYFETGMGSESFVVGTLYTDKGALTLGLEFEIDEKTGSYKNFKTCYPKAGGPEDFIESNVLSANKWLDAMLYLQENDIAYSVAAMSAMLADGYAKYFYNVDFNGLSGTIKGVAVDEALAICASLFYTDYFEVVEKDEKGYYAVVTLDEARELAYGIFDITKIDFTSSPSYDAKTKTLKVRIPDCQEGYLYDTSLKYQNGKFVIEMDWDADCSETIMPVRIVTSETGIIESISFTEASCGGIKTITAENAKGGVKVAYSAAENATEYEIYRSTNGGKYEKVGTTAELSYLDTTVKSNTTYTYKVRGVNEASQGTFSTTKTVKYLAMPKTTATITKTGFTVKWTKVDGASTYRIYRAQYTNGKWSAWTKISDQKASVSSFADKGVKAGGIYKYTVRALASGGVASAYEGTASLVFLKAPTVKIANAKAGVKVTWSAVAGAKEYIVYRSVKSGSSWSSWTVLATVKSDVKAYTDTKAESGKTYRYTVKAVNGKSQGTFVATSGLLFLAEPVVKTTNAKNGITVKWGKIAGAQSYTIYRATYNSSTKKWSGWSNMGSVKSTNWTDKGAKAGLVYKYTVRAVNGKTLSTFTAAASIVRLVEAKVTIANSKAGVTVKWNKVASAKNYVIYRSEQVNGKWTSWKNMGTLKNTVFAWTDTSAVSGTLYRYTVRAVNGASQSSFTASKTLMFLAQPNVTFANASNGMKVSWNKVDGATQYIVYSATYNATTKKWSGWTNRGKVTSTTWTDKNVKSGTYYKYTVKAVNGSYTSTFMATSGLLRLAQPTVKAAETINGINVTWNKIAGAKNYVVYRSEYANGAWTGWTNKGTLANTKLSWTDTGIVVGSKYRYTIKAINNKASSSFKATGGIVATDLSVPYITENNVKAKMTPLLMNYHSLYESHDVHLASYKNYISLLPDSWYQKNDPYHYTARLYKFKTVKSEAELRSAYKQYLSASLVDNLKFGNLVKIDGTMYFAYMAGAGSTSYDMNSIKFVGEKDGGYLVSVHCYNSGDVYYSTETFLVKNVNGKLILDSRVSETFEYDDIYVSPTYDSIYNYYN